MNASKARRGWRRRKEGKYNKEITLPSGELIRAHEEEIKKREEGG